MEAILVILAIIICMLVFIIGPIAWCAFLNWQERTFTRVELEEDK